MLFSLLKHYLDIYITDTALKESRSLYCFTTSISHGVENYFLRLWGTGISDAIFLFCCLCPLTVPRKIIRLPKQAKKKGGSHEVLIDDVDLDSSMSETETEWHDGEKKNQPETDTVSLSDFDKLLRDSKKVLSDCIEKLQGEDMSVGERDKLMEEMRKHLARPVNIELEEEDYQQILSVGVELNVPKVVSSEILKYKVSALDQSDENFLVDCFWILTNIASGRCDQTWSVILAGAVPFAMEIVQECPLIKLVTQCIILLGNILVEDEATLNDIIHGGICHKAYAMFELVDTHSKGEILSFYCKMIKARHLYLPEEMLKKMIRQAASILNDRYPRELLLPVMELIIETTRVRSHTGFPINVFTENGYTTKLVSCLSHKDTKVRSFCLVSLGSLLLGTAEQNWAALKSGLLNHLLALLFCEDFVTVYHALWILSNITAGEETMMDAIFDFDFLPTVIYYLTCEEPDLVFKALWTINKLIRGCNQKKRLDHLVQNKELIQGFLIILKRDKKHIQTESRTYFSYYKLIHECFSHLLDRVFGVCEDRQSSVKEIYSVLGVEEVLTEMVESRECCPDTKLAQDFLDLVDMLNEMDRTSDTE